MNRDGLLGPIIVLAANIAQLATAVWAVAHFGWLVIVPIVACGMRIEWKFGEVNRSPWRRIIR